MTFNRNIYNVTQFQPYIDNIINCADTLANQYGLENGRYFKKNSFNHPTALVLNELDGTFDAIPNRLIRKTPNLLNTFKDLERAMNIDSLILTRYITRFQPDDFLKWRKSKKSIGKFLSISTTDTHLSFLNELIVFKPYHAISFNTQDTYSITNVKNMENWIVFMIPDHEYPLKDYELNF